MANRGKERRRKKIAEESGVEDIGMTDKKADELEKKKIITPSGENKEFFEVKTEFSLLNKAKKLFKNRAFKFVLLFTILITAFYAMFLLFIDKIGFIINFVAGNVGFLLNLFGFNATVKDSHIIMENFSLDIIFECTPLFTILIYIACVLAYPAKINAKIKGIIFGGILIYFIDIARLFSLAIVGNALSREIFNSIHTYLWQITLIVVILAIWLLWIDKFTKTTKVIPSK